LTLAVGAVKVFVLWSTTVAAVPVAPTSVVGVVTVSVANKTYDFAITFALPVFALPVRVEAFALVTAVLRTMQKTGAYITAVTIVPVTTAVIIFCVAEFVTHPGNLSTLAIALLRRRFLFKSRVQTPALATKLVIVFDTTTVAAVPVANLGVVRIIAIAVLLEFLDPATFRFFLVGARFSLGVQALTQIAVRLSLGFIELAAVTTVPIARAVVIGIVAIAVTFEGEVGTTTARAFRCFF